MGGVAAPAVHAVVDRVAGAVERRAAQVVHWRVASWAAVATVPDCRTDPKVRLYAPTTARVKAWDGRNSCANSRHESCGHLVVHTGYRAAECKRVTAIDCISCQPIRALRRQWSAKEPGCRAKTPPDYSLPNAGAYQAAVRPSLISRKKAIHAAPPEVTPSTICVCHRCSLFLSLLKGAQCLLKTSAAIAPLTAASCRPVVKPAMSAQPGQGKQSVAGAVQWSSCSAHHFISLVS